MLFNFVLSGAIDLELVFVVIADLDIILKNKILPETNDLEPDYVVSVNLDTYFKSKMPFHFIIPGSNVLELVIVTSGDLETVITKVK